MNVIKEYCEYANVCVIRTENYGSSMKYFRYLVGVAKQDFPYLDEENIEIKHYAGERYKKTFGIEFKVPNGYSVPSDYQLIQNLEYTL